MKSVQLDSVHTRQFLIKCNSFSQLNDMTNCPHPFATLGDCEQVLPPSVVAAHPTRCVYLGPVSLFWSLVECVWMGMWRLGRRVGRSAGRWIASDHRRSGRGDCIEFSVRNSPFGKTWHAMSFQNIMTCHIFSSHHTWLLCMGSLHRWFARLLSSISSSPSRILWPPSLFEWSLFKSFVLGLVPYTISC